MKKVRTTIFLSEETHKMLFDMWIEWKRRQRNVHQSDVIENALKQLHTNWKVYLQEDTTKS